MTKQQFARAVEIAKSEQDMDAVDFNNLIGYGLPEFKPTITTLRAVAKMIRYQTLQFNGEFDCFELSDLAAAAQRKFIVAEV